MLTHSYNWIMAPLMMRSWEGHTAYWMSYVAVTSFMTGQPTISFPSFLCRVYSRRQATPNPDLEDKNISVNMIHRNDMIYDVITDCE